MIHMELHTPCSKAICDVMSLGRRNVGCKLCNAYGTIRDIFQDPSEVTFNRYQVKSVLARALKILIKFYEELRRNSTRKSQAAGVRSPERNFCQKSELCSRDSEVIEPATLGIRSIPRLR